MLPKSAYLQGAYFGGVPEMGPERVVVYLKSAQRAENLSFYQGSGRGWVGFRSILTPPPYVLKQTWFLSIKNFCQCQQVKNFGYVWSF